MQTLRLFVSSSGDARGERQAVGRIVHRLQAQHADSVRLELQASRSPECDVLIWIRGSSAGAAAKVPAGEGAVVLAYRRKSKVSVPKGKSTNAGNRRSAPAKEGDPFAYASVEQFSILLEKHLEELIHRAPGSVAPEPPAIDRAPFVGLRPYDFTEAALFRGRERETAEALAKLKENHAAGRAFLLIHGSSGSGKSSLMRAGVAPVLTAEGEIPEAGAWAGTSLFPVETGATPLLTLARALEEAIPGLAKLPDSSARKPEGPAGAVWDDERLARMMEEQDSLVFATTALMAALDRMSAGKPAHLLILLDQLEEIFTERSISREQRTAYFRALAAMAATGRIWIVATMRSEFLLRVTEYPDLLRLSRSDQDYLLAPPEPAGLRQIIRSPVSAAGLGFGRDPETGRDLADEIEVEAARRPDPLPLLAFTLEGLYLRREEKLLTWQAFRELGGLEGAIPRRAQEAFDTLPAATRQEAARRIFGELVILDPPAETLPVPQRVKRETLDAVHPAAPAFLDAFISAGLLVAASDKNYRTVALAHETLASHWPLLSRWIEDHHDLLNARRRLEDSARAWIDGKRSQNFLLKDSRLAEAELLLESGSDLTAEETELIRRSKARTRRKLRMFQVAAVVCAALAITAGAIALTDLRKSESPAEIAGVGEHLSALAAADFDAGAARVEAGAPDEALPFLIAALESDPEHQDAQALLLATLRRTAWNFPVAEIRHPLPVTRLAFGDGTTLYSAIGEGASGDGLDTVLRWDLRRGAMDAVLMPAAQTPTETLSLAPGARRAIIRRGGATLLCDGATLKPLKRLPFSPASAAEVMAWSPEGALLAYPADLDGGISWVIADANSGETIRQSGRIGAGDVAEPLAVQLDRERLLAVHRDGTLVELPLSPLVPMRTTHPPAGEDFYSEATLSADGTELMVRLRSRESEPASYRVDEGPEGLRLLPWDKGNGSSLIPAPHAVDGSKVTLNDIVQGRVSPAAPLHMESAVSAVASGHSSVAVGTKSGLLAVHQTIPRMDYPLKGGAKGREEDWALLKVLNKDTRAEARASALRLDTGGESIPVETPRGWTTTTDIALSADGRWLVLAGPGGLALGHTGPEQVPSRQELLDPASCVTFLGDSHRVAVAGPSEVGIYEASDSGFKKTGTIPVPGATGLFSMPHAGWLAVATGNQVTLHAPDDLSRIATLPFARTVPADDGPACPSGWAEDFRNGWLAFATHRSLTFWSVRNRRILLADLPLAEGTTAMSFDSQGGFRGLKLEGANEGFVPLAKETGLQADELDALRAFSESLGGTRIAEGGRSILRLSREERLRSLARVPTDVAKLIPGGDPTEVRKTVMALPFLRPEAQAWLPLWERLATWEAVNPRRLAVWSATLRDHPWRRNYLRALIAEQDARLFEAWGTGTGDADSPAAEDRATNELHELAGDTAEARELKRASLLAARAGPDRRPEAIAKLDTAVETTRKASGSGGALRNILAHAEALALRGELEAAAEFVRGKIPPDAKIDLDQAHFLLSAGLEPEAREALEKTLPALGSPWLWRQWLRARTSGEADILPPVERTVNAVDGSGPAAVEALKIALEKKHAPSIAACVKAAKDLPEPLRLYAAGAALWADGKKAETFALWPEGFPAMREEAGWKDWAGWEHALPEPGQPDLFHAMEQELAILEPAPDATITDLQAIAMLLLDPKTTTTFGVKRVRDAMLRIALGLSDDKASGDLVAKLVERARLAGAPHPACLRIEARSFMAAGEFTAAYARWIELIDSGDAEISPQDYVEAARCVIEDMQDAAAIELLMRGKAEYPKDAAYAFDASWLLLTTGHPEEAGVLLEHGFGLPFAADQKEVALAMLVCAAEQTLRTERADQAFAELLGLSPEWGVEESLKNLEWPEGMKQSLMAVAERNR